MTLSGATLPPLTVWAPHLSVSLYSEDGERAAFARLAEAVTRHGGTGTRRVDVVPAGHAEQEPRPLDVDPAEFDRLVAGKDDDWTAVQAGFVTAAAGPLVLTYLRRHDDEERHPVEARVYADELGLPDFVRDAEQDAAAARMAAWVRGLLRDACESVDPLYSEVSIETTLPTPSVLAASQLSNVYVADRLLAVDAHLEGDLRAVYETGAVVRWRTGVYFSSWAPFNDAGASASDDTGHHTAMLLDRAIGRLLRSR